MVSPPRDHWWRCWFEEAEDAQLVCQRDGTSTELNRKAIQFFGPAVNANEPFCLLSELTPNAAQRLAELLRRESGQQKNLPGVTLMVGGRLSLIADLQITPLGEGYSLVTVKDASRRWRMESHVTRLITAVDSTRNVIFTTDANFRLTFVNSAFQTVTGYGVEEILGREADFLRAPGQESQITQYREAVARGSDWRGELVNVTATGHSYPVETNISPIYDTRGGFLGYVAVERDISQQRKLQEALQIERNFVLSIINSLEAAVYTMDRSFCLTHVNDGWKRLPARHGLLTVTEQPVAGRSLLEIVESEAHRAELQGYFKKVLDNGESHDFVATFPEGTHWQIKISPWFHHGQIQGLIYAVNDRSRFHELERQLFQAQKMETVGALAAGVAHDFNNLLQAIRGNVTVLQLADSLPADVLHRIEHIDEAARQAADITQQLLSFSRVADDSEPILDWNQMLKQVGQMSQRTALSKVTVRVVCTDSPLKVRMHSTRAQQALLNLCVNAVDAMPNGGQLTLTNAPVALNKGQLARVAHLPGTEFFRCSISDTGTGIPPALLSKIFDPFFTTKAAGKGTGLGLSIVHSIINQAGGILEVETEAGKGTTFHIYLPLVRAALTERSRSENTGVVKGKGRLLVVDDLELVLDFTSTFLRAAGYEVLTAMSAEEACEVLEDSERPVDLLLTDYNMGGRNGEQLIEEVTERWPGTKVILATGYLQEKDRRAIEEKYKACVLHKPFNIQEAAGLINRMLEPQPAEGESTTSNP